MISDFAELATAGAPVLLLWLAAIVARTPHQERSNRLLALFLVTVALGFVAELVASLNAIWWSEGLAFAARAVEYALGLADPPLLLAFSLNFPRPSPRWRPGIVTVAYGTAGAAITLAFVTGGWGYYGPLPNPPAEGALIVYVNGTYLAAFAILLGRFVDERHPFLAREIQFAAIAVGFVAVSRSGAVFFVRPAMSPARLAAPLVSLVLATVQLGGVLALVSRRRRGTSRRPVAAVGRPVLAITAGFFAAWALTVLLDRALGSPENGFANLFFVYRWFFFALILGYGILRYQVFDYEFKVAHAGALIVAVALAAAAGLATASGTEDVGASVQTAATAGLAASLLVGAAAYGVGLVATRALAPALTDAPTAVARRLEVYEATLEYALGDDDLDEPAERFLESLREVFDVRPEVHAAVLDRLRRVRR